MPNHKILSEASNMGTVLMEDNDVRERMRTPGPIQCDQKSAQFVNSTNEKEIIGK